MSPEQSRRAIFLEEMGLGPLWSNRFAPLVVTEVPFAETALQAVSTAVVRPVAKPAAAPAVSVADDYSAFDDAMSSWTEEDELPLAMPVWEELSLTQTAAVSPARIATMDWSQLKETVAACTACGLCRGRTKTAFGVGDEKASWLFIGEGPGRNEDLQGEPFVGPAGKLLDNMLNAIGLQRGDNAYIANIVKCRPTDADGRDRAPTPEEAAACLPYLQRQIALVQPDIIVALGKTAALSLLGLDPNTTVAKLRGTVHRYRGLPLVVTYHPAYLLRSLTDKSKAWADLCLAMTTLASANASES